MASAKRSMPLQYGDFQTPPELAEAVCRLLSERGIQPYAIVEPTCGRGNFLLAALNEFSEARLLGIEINPAHVDSARAALADRADTRCQVLLASAFDTDWKALSNDLPGGPILILGNPPWVTNAAVSAAGGSNVPPKANEGRLSGIDALTGKSNFDLSEWLMIRLIEAVGETGRGGWLAMLCKSAVARRVLGHAWERMLPLRRAEIRTIDAAELFHVSVDACLLVVEIGTVPTKAPLCDVHESWDSVSPSRTFGRIDGRLVADLGMHKRWGHLAGGNDAVWRSGIKHDCSRIMELRREGEGTSFQNGFRETVELEEDFLYPMFKSSAIARGRVASTERWMLVPQRATGDKTDQIQAMAPRTWAYLQKHRASLDRRKSAIYRNRPPFSVFGVGSYSFSPWKVAVSGFYKRLQFAEVGPILGKPVVFDDTVYFLPCHTQAEAHLIAKMLNSEAARGFLEAFLFRDAKRPITTDLLRRLDLGKLAAELGLSRELQALSDSASPAPFSPIPKLRRASEA